MAASPESVGLATAILRDGGIVAVPTETVYGLTANAASATGVAAIYRAKGRPDFNPLIVHVPDIAAVEKIASPDIRARKLAEIFWPGPLTMVLPLKEGAAIAGAVTAGLPTIALRCPAHPVMQALLQESGLFLAAPSANRSGGISPTRAAHVARSLGDAVPLIIDGGPSQTGLESTIIALRPNGWQILRHGPIAETEIANLLGTPPLPVTQQSIEAPGQLANHYAPAKPLRLNAENAADDEWLIGFGSRQGDDNLSPTGDLAEAAANLYDALHRADMGIKARIAIVPLPETGIGIAIADRLRRAAAS